MIKLTSLTNNYIMKQAIQSASSPLHGIQHLNPSQEIKNRLSEVYATHISPISPPTHHLHSHITPLRSLTTAEYNTLKNLTTPEQQTLESTRAQQKACLLVKSLFPNLMLSPKYTVTAPNTYVFTGINNTSLKIALQPNSLYYIEYPTKIMTNTPLAFGKYKEFSIQNHKGRLIPITHASSEKIEANAQGIYSLRPQTLPILTRHILKGVERKIPGSELLVIPDIVQSPNEENNNTAIYVQSYCGKETLQNRVIRELKEGTASLEKAKARLRDIIMANEALLKMNLYNLDIKLCNSVIHEENNTERVLQIDLDDLADKHFSHYFSNQVNNSNYVHKVRETFSDANLYMLLKDMTKDIKDSTKRRLTFTMLYQNITYLKLLNKMLPKETIKNNITLRLLQNKTIKDDPSMLFVIDNKPLAFLNTMLFMYMNMSKTDQTDYNHNVKRISQMIDVLRASSLTSSKRAIQFRFAMSKHFTKEDLNLISSEKFLKLHKCSQQQPIEKIYNEKARQLLKENIDLCAADIRNAYCVKDKLSDSSLETLTMLLIAPELLFQTCTMSGRKLKDLAKSTSEAVKKIAEIEKYKEEKIPRLFTLLPVTSENDRF